SRVPPCATEVRPCRPTCRSWSPLQVDLPREHHVEHLLELRVAGGDALPYDSEPLPSGLSRLSPEGLDPHLGGVGQCPVPCLHVETGCLGLPCAGEAGVVHGPGQV